MTQPTDRSPRPRTRGLLGGLTLSALVIASCGGGGDGDWEAKFWWGAHVAPEEPESRRAAIERFDAELGQKMNSARVYRRWEDKFPTKDHLWLAKQSRLVVLSIKPIREDGSFVPWAEIAAAEPGSDVYAELLGWADKVREFNAPIYVALHHEPEGGDDQAAGSAKDYLGAWKTFADVMRTEGGEKVRTMWIMTDLSFTSTAPIEQQAAGWYPGDDLIDAIGVDAFNWSSCRGRDEPWQSLETLVDPARVFAAARPDKELWIAEFGSFDDPADPNRRQQWLADAAALPNKPGWEQLHGMLHFDDVITDKFPNCDWRLGGQPNALAALAELKNIPRDRPPASTQAATSPDPQTST